MANIKKELDGTGNNEENRGRDRGATLMGNTDSASRTLKGSVTGWPNLSWVTSYAGADKLSPDPSRALLDGVRERDDAVVITAREGERKFTAGVSVADPVLRRGIVISLRKAVGRTLNDVGGMEIVSRP